MFRKLVIIKLVKFFELTISTESREAMAKISAHETTLGHAASTLDLIASITSKPLTELLFAAAVFSPLKDDVSSSSIDPSQPCSNTVNSQ